ncbi:MAG: PSD1 and planctomycete cytochrome C domain-containing protein [Planctomycetaceae bacterium]
MKSLFHRRLLLLIGACVAALIAWPRERADSQEAPTFDAASIEFFQSKVKPLLETRCFECHGPDTKVLKGGLSLASRAAILRGGDSGAAIVLGKPAESLLVKAINYVDFEMPPKSRLPEGEVAILTEWVKRGAPWSIGKDDPARDLKPEAFPLAERKAKHWAWKPIAHFEPPKVRQTFQADPNVNASTFRESDNIDQFILSKLDERGLTHAPAADRRTLLRRVYFALIGLPPTPAEADEFVADKAPTREALSRVVDRLLESPHFGERWGRHWLDLVRYAETLGHEFDFPLHHAHQYRDYVIRALNADVPYDRFVVEHVAGDLLNEGARGRGGEGAKNKTQSSTSLPLSPSPPLPLSRPHPTDGYNESLIATGFWFLGEDKHAPVDAKGEQATRIDNQLDVFSRTFLALTVACARCHDHKFDAIRTMDYYALAGFLQSSRRQTAYLDPHGKIDAAVAEIKQRTAGGPRSPEISSSYLLAARELLHGTPKPEDAKDVPPGQQPDELFEDFESDSFAKWKVEGSAFERGPAAGTLPGQMPVSGFEGQRLLNSWAGSDDHTGKLTSQPFVIRHRSIKFLIGGGKHPGETCFNLKVGGKVVQTATGKNNERVEPMIWDVSPWRDQEAVLEVVDSRKGGWGHINLDQIVFSNAGDSFVTKRPLAAVARESKVHPVTLEQVARLLQSDEVRRPTHPWWLWHEFTSRPLDPKPEAFETRKRELAERIATEQKRADESLAKSELYEDFSSVPFVDLQHPAESRKPKADRRDPFSSNKKENGSRPSAVGDRPEQTWFATGWSFDNSPNADGVAHSGELSLKLRGVLRSPTFTITQPQILYRVTGKNARIRLVLDGYQMMDFSGLLFSGTTFEVNTDGQWIWHRQAGDLQNHLGRRAYIELIDDGDGWIACDEIRFTNGGPEPTAPPHPNHANLLADSSIKSVNDLATALTGLGERGGARLGERGGSPETEIPIPEPLRAIAICDGNAIDEHVFIRGNHKNLGPEVGRRNLEALDGIDQPIVDHESGSGRLQLALRLIDAKSNPFVPRVAVNRVWHHLFGRGIVESVDNFGVLGKEPTHPELLDHLAETFVADGWSLKRLIRRIVLTNAWEMASETGGSRSRETSEGAEKDRPNSHEFGYDAAKANELDPQNLWLHRAPIHRLEGEAIRDSMLLIAGRLNRQTLGPSVPVHLTPFMQGRGRPGNSGPLDGDGRRSIYTSINRNFLSPMMLAFDTPIPFTTIGRRNISNVPAQALILMNDPFVLDMSKRWAERSLKEQPDLNPEQRIERLYLDAFTRSPTAAEQAEAYMFLSEQAKSSNLPADAWSKHAQVWTDLCHVLFNVKEFVFVK